MLLTASCQDDLVNIILLDLVRSGAVDKQVAFGDMGDDIELQQEQAKARQDRTEREDDDDDDDEEEEENEADGDDDDLEANCFS
eukprot:748922-Hanusia_phi.AAC.2